MPLSMDRKGIKMAQVIVYENERGGVSLCIPADENDIQRVLAEDCPDGSLIVDEQALPSEYNALFDAWKLVEGVVCVDLDAAKEVAAQRLVSQYKANASKLASDVAIGLAQASELEAIKAAHLARIGAVNTATSAATVLAQLKSAGIE